ncbi:methyltransferase [Nocardia sp. NPDC127526]|uniref:methyltransferase n=1 Tax=Nocardia sp. NPDC127526 TaxID=3345393 RepID=UPI00363E51DC
MTTPRFMPPPRVARAAEAAHARLRRSLLQALPPPLSVLSLADGWLLSQAVCTAARLGIADALAGGPRPAAEIAERIGADPDATYRLLRMLAGHGVFHELRDRRFELNAVADPLRTDSPQSVRPLLAATAHPVMWATGGQLLRSVQTGRSGHELAHGTTGFEHLAADPELAAAFHDAMRVTSQLAAGPLLAAVDYSRYGTIADIGGGSGYLLAAILAAAPRSRGVLYDLAPATADAPGVLRAAGVAERCTIENGSFFDSVPAGADVYVLKNIIHDWPDDTALTVLRAVRAAIVPGGRLHLVECLIPEQRNTTHLSLWLDLHVLLTIGGRERTAAEYRALLETAGFGTPRITATAAPLSIIEAVPV